VRDLAALGVVSRADVGARRPSHSLNVASSSGTAGRGHPGAILLPGPSRLFCRAGGRITSRAVDFPKISGRGGRLYGKKGVKDHAL
jgi:hypothetical protein